MVGPLEVLVELDEALARVAPDGWGTTSGAYADETIRLHAWSRPGLRISGFDAEGRFTAGGCRLQRRLVDGHVVTTGESAVDRAALTRAIRFATQPSLLGKGWLLLHGSSVLLPDGVHVFVAASGTGKSTLARRLVRAGATLVGDEVALVGEGKVAVHPGQLVHGPLDSPFALAAIHLLGRGGPSSTPARKVGAAAELLSAAMVYEDGRPAAERAIALVDELVSCTPVFETRVPDDDRALALLGLGAVHAR